MVEDVMCDLDPEQGIEEEYAKKNDPVYCWKFMRITSFDSISKLDSKPENHKEAQKLKIENITKQFVCKHT